MLGISILKHSYLPNCVFLQVLVLLTTSCFPYQSSIDEFLAAKTPPPTQEEELLIHHWLYQIVPPHRSLIHWYDLPHWITWALVGNDDDGLFGEGPLACYCTDESPGKRAVKWALRNPLHNLTFYAIGSAGSKNSEFTILSTGKKCFKLMHYKNEAETVFASEGTSLYFGLHGWKPFFSFRFRYSDSHTFDTYLGWRERGNFGGKLRPWCKS